MNIEPPIVSTNTSHILVSPGDNIDLICDVAGQTFPDISWFKGNELVRFCIIKFEFLMFSIKGNSSSNKSKWIFTNKNSI